MEANALADGERRTGAFGRATARFLEFMAPGVNWDGDQKTSWPTAW